MSHTHIVSCLKIAGFLTEEAEDVGEMLVPNFVEDLQGFRCLAKEHLPRTEEEQLKWNRLTLSWEFSMTFKLFSEEVMSGPNSTQPVEEEYLY